MDGKETRHRLHEVFGPHIRFNRDFDLYAEKLKVGMVEDFLSWCKGAKEGRELGSVPPNPRHKHLYIFFRKIASDVRAVLIKEQNSGFIEVILASHRQYDDKRLELGYKKSSYYGS